MNRKLTWKLIIIVAVLLTLGNEMFPPQSKLRGGPDLKGGVTFTYEVDTGDAPNPSDLIKQVIEVLKQRVDPRGVRNIAWRVDSGSRIQIQMPLPLDSVIEKRNLYQQQMTELGDTTISRTQASSVLRAQGSARTSGITALAGQVPGRLEALQAAAASSDQLAAARAKYDAATDDEKIDLAQPVALAEQAFNQNLDDVMATNLDATQVGLVLDLPTKQKFDENGDAIAGSSAREKALENLNTEYASRTDEIEALRVAHDDYQNVKGPLDDPNDLIRLLQGAGVLNFRIGVDTTEATNLTELKEQLQNRGPNSFGANDPMRWYIIEDVTGWVDDEAGRAFLETNPEAFFEGRGLIGAEMSGEYYVLLWNTDAKAIADQPGWQLDQAMTDIDGKGRPCVAFRLNAIGANLMGNLTSNNTNRKMAIVLDGQVYSAPEINGRINDSGIITGRYSKADLAYLIRTLNAGSLKAALSKEPIEVRTIQPTIGAENLKRGMQAAFGALITVAVFIMIYYFFAGMVAGIALMANLIIILGMMAFLRGTFTLPGIAGIVLTIGMCVDANVLVFERIREELRNGADMITALRLGYQKAFSSIIDGNLTNLIVCVILGYTASAEVRGFAVTLGIGICATLFTSLYMTHAIFDVFYKVLGAKKMAMLPLAIPAIENILHPNINWIDKRKAFFTVSIIAIIASLLLTISRGSDLLDIEFSAGTEVVFDLKEGQTLSVDEVREKLRAAVADNPDDLKDLTVVAVGDQTDDYKAGAFSVLTTNDQPKAVATIVQDTFAGVIDNPPPLSFNHQTDDPAQFKKLMYDVVFPVDLEDTTLPLTLGNVIGQPEITDPIDTHQGGVAILLDNLTPAATLDDIRSRIEKMRFQPDFEGEAYRQFDVIGVDTDPANPQLYKTVAVVSHDPKVSFFDDADGWSNLLASKEWSLVSQALARETSLSKVTNFSPIVAETLRQQAIVALLFSCIAIVAYIWFRFGSLRYGLAAIAALVHDVIITLGLVSVSSIIYNTIGDNFLLLEPFKLNMGLIAALLTIIGYSLNDTIVLFDRIRENRGKLDLATPAIINGSINQVISRTMLTSFTTFLAVFIMYAFGGSGIHGFAFALVCGVLVGTYSSIAIASPLLLISTKYAKANINNATS